MLLFLLACGSSEKDTTDTAVPSEPSSEASTEPSSEASTEPSEEPTESDFPELQEELDVRLEAASPIPMSSESMDNTTVMGGFLFAYIPQITLQMMISEVGQENVTCPTIEGTFPEDGLPTEEVVVTGGGCTDASGTTYEGSFVYNSEGITYSDYTTTYPSEEEGCDLFSQTIFNGGYRMEMGMSTEVSYLIHMENEEILEDCSGLSTNDIIFKGDMIIGQGGGDDSQLVNGEATWVYKVETSDYFMEVLTQDELIDNAVCETEPASGTNTMTNGIDEYVYTFDGATDCDEEPTQMLSVNGGEPTEVSGASCSTMSSRSGMLGMMFAFALSFARRRRS